MITNEQRLKRFASPRPVEPAAPTAPSTYKPAPRIGESPRRPGIFHDKPLVVVTPQISPFELMPSQLIVPCKFSGRSKPSATICSAALNPAAARFFGSILFAGSTRRDHSSHILRDCLLILLPSTFCRECGEE